ncbi:MAG: ROK family protein [Mycoplasma sp.]
MKILTIDIGGTTTKMAIIDDKGTMIKKYPAIPTHKGHNLKWLFDDLKNIKEDYDYIGIDVPGTYNEKDNIIASAGNLEYKNFDIHAEVKKYTNKKSFILNDANAAALGEFWKLEGNYNNAIFYILGTGIGGGIIINKKLYSGSQGYAGEFGHGWMLNHEPCKCGQFGCIEPFSSAKGITNKVNEYAVEPKYKKLHAFYLEKQKTSDPRIHLNEINDLVNEKDEGVMLAVKEALIPLVKHMSIMTYALNPEIIIVGGGPSNYGDPFLEIISEMYIESVGDFLIPTVDLVLARQLNDAALYGCAYHVIKSLDLNK